MREWRTSSKGRNPGGPGAGAHEERGLADHGTGDGETGGFRRGVEPASGSDVPGTAAIAIRDRVRWSDVDAAGIVCFGRFLRFFEIAEEELLRRHGLSHPLLASEHGVHLLRRRIECDFHRPLRHEDEVEASCTVQGVGTTSITLGFRLTREPDGAPVADARYLLVAVDVESLRKIVLPTALRVALAAAA